MAWINKTIEFIVLIITIYSDQVSHIETYSEDQHTNKKAPKKGLKN
jgi:hypothetical protein